MPQLKAEAKQQLWVVHATPYQLSLALF